ncbi:MAG: Ppx/GppA family phosphatase, partial [Geobacter sp.]
GAWISYERPHKHSYHLIRHADLFGLSPRERELAAQIARYHRKALPKKKHEPFQKLSAKEQGLVSRLGGILRLADGLDRRRCSAVEQISCQIQDKLARVTVSGSDDLAVEVFGGSAKKELFEKAFSLQVVFAVQPETRG